MGKIRVRKALFLRLLAVLLLAVQSCLLTAAADDVKLQADLPGQWIFSDQGQAGEQPAQIVDLAFLALKESGKLSLLAFGQDGGYAFACEGTWSFELVQNGLDRLTLLFSLTDNPLYADSGYGVECVYDVYEESWVEKDTLHTYLILEPVSCSGISPFEDLAGYGSVALHREKGPNLRVVNCRDYVSLREKPSRSSARLAEVPLGALVLADPADSALNGFILCSYQDRYGYILSEYLQPVEPDTNY